VTISKRTRIQRFFGGAALVLVLLAVIFALLPPLFHTWGATEVEIARTYPGDDLLSAPALSWTHAMTVDASPDQVWPWIAQLGERRGAYYSYTFIENLIAGEKLYVNADRILPEHQNPQPGVMLIGGMLAVREVKPGQWMLAESTEALDELGLGWTWLWWIAPHGAGQTRLIVRGRIQPPEGMDNPVLGWFIDAGSFVMGRRMLQGLALRAEGRSEPAYIEAVEIVLWLAALLAGLGAGALFLWREPWQPLLVGLASVLCLVWFTFWIPPVGLRLLADVALWGALIWLYKRKVDFSQKTIYHRMKALNARMVANYRRGIGPTRIVLLLTTVGRKSGLPRVTPLQFEEVDGAYYVASARGPEADWFKNILANPNVHVTIRKREFDAIAEPILEPARIADFIELRLRRHPIMIRLIMHLFDGLPLRFARADLEEFCKGKAMVILYPQKESMPH